MTRIAVVGAGAWGTVLADLLSRKGDSVTIWAREPEVVDSINREHHNHLFLPASPLAADLRAGGDIAAIGTRRGGGRFGYAVACGARRDDWCRRPPSPGGRSW